MAGTQAKARGEQQGSERQGTQRDGTGPRRAEPALGEQPGELIETASRLRFAIARLNRLLRQQDQGEMSPTLSAALVTIAREGPLTLGMLATLEHVAPPSITRVVAKLEDAGFVVREDDPVDRRVTLVRLSAAGRHQLEINRVRRTAWLLERVEQLSAQDRTRLEEAVAVIERLIPGQVDR